MRINGNDNLLYTYQAQSHAVPDVEKKSSDENLSEKSTSESRPADLLQAGVVVEINSITVGEELPKQQSKQKEKVWKQIAEMAEKDWKSLREWVKKMIENGKQLVEKVRRSIKSLFEETENMAGKVGNPAITAEKREEGGVAPLTWQENFKQKVKMFFDAVSGFLAKHLPMSNGGFSGTKEENKEDELEGKEKQGKKQGLSSQGDATDMSGSNFDQRG